MGCTTSWTHFGMTIVGENMFTNVLPLQEMKHLSLTALNNAFGEAVKIISNVRYHTVIMSVPIVCDTCYFAECSIQFDREEAKAVEQHQFCIAEYNEAV